MYSRKIYETQIIGTGPAGLGIAVAADRVGALSTLLSRGVAFIDKNSPEQIGGGQFRNLGIRSNSPGGDYLESINPKGVFGNLLATEAGQKLAEQRTELVPLTLVAEFLETLGKRLREVVSDFPESDVLPSTEISGIEYFPNHADRFVSGTVAEQRRFVSKNIVLATGGRETPIDLGSGNEKLFLASDLLHDQISDALRARMARFSCPNIVILGGAHSAFSAAWKIRQDFIATDFPHASVTIVHRHPVRLFYNTPEEAAADAYAFDPAQDVCLTTNRVNRFSGIRGDAKKLARAVTRGEVPEVRLLACIEENRAAVTHHLATAAVIIQATGYVAASVPLLNEAGEVIGPRAKGNGQLDVTPTCGIFDTNGNCVPRAYAVGLGHGITPDPSIGGEPSFKHGVLDAVNLYHGKIGELILEQLLS